MYCACFSLHMVPTRSDGLRRVRQCGHTLILIRERERPRERAPNASESESESESERANERASRSARAPAQGFLSPCTGAQSEARGGGARERRPLSLSLVITLTEIALAELDHARRSQPLAVREERDLRAPYHCCERRARASPSPRSSWRP